MNSLRRFSALALCLTLGAGCGDDSGGGEMMPTNNCPTKAPDSAALMGPCCSRASNAERLDAPELRIAGLRITKPTSLASPIVGSALSDALDKELFNWLIRAEVSGTNVTLTTGYGKRNADSTYSFTNGAAPAAGGDPNRWNPVTVTGTIDSMDKVVAPPLADAFAVPIFDEAMENLQFELPFNDFEVRSAQLSESRSCVGSRGVSLYTPAGEASTYITVESATTAQLKIGTAISTTLCMFMANMAGETGTCADIPRRGGTCAMPSECETRNGGPGGTCVNGACQWPVLPDALCNEMGCRANAMGSTDVCDPAMEASSGGCNAWQVLAQFAAHGVEITD